MTTSTRIAIAARVLRSRRVPLAIWAVTMVGVCGLYAGLYPSMEKVDMNAMMEALPPALIEALGYEDMTTAAGYVGSAVYGLIAFFLLSVFAIMNGAKLIGGDEQDGSLELELCAPLPRTSIYAQRLLALWLQLSALATAVLFSTWVTDLIAGLAIDKGQLLSATFHLWLVLGLFGTVAFGAGAASGRRAVGLGAGVGLLLVGWMLNALGPMLGYDWMPSISPVGWYMDDNPVTRGSQPVDALLTSGTVALCAVGGWLAFLRRDLMTS
jgi:ABC-2 type transport system permease protein